MIRGNKYIITPFYSSARNIGLKEIKLKFINSTLYFIEIRERKGLIEFFDLKYGRGKLKKVREDLIYYDKNIDKFVSADLFKNIQCIREWKTRRKNIKCMDAFRVYYNVQTGKKQFSPCYFSLYDSSISSDILMFRVHFQGKSEIGNEKAKI